MIYTGYYAKAKQYQEVELELVAISIGRPSAFRNCRKETELMPSWDMVNGVKSGRMTKEDYAAIFNKKLEKLSAWSIEQIYRGCIFLCYEKPGEICHRHLVAEWLRANGFECEEFKMEEKTK